MLKFIISFGKNTFSFMTSPVLNNEGKLDMKATIKHVQNVVGKEATIELV